MRAIIPAAGRGTRLRPHTHTLPKVLLNVAGKPIIGHIIEGLQKDGIDELTVIIGYQGNKVSDYIDSTFDLPTKYVWQEERKGLGHAVGMGLEDSDEPALILLGDTIFDADFSDILEVDGTTIGVTEVEDPRRFGVVEVENDYVSGLVEKPDDPPSNLALVGIYKIASQRQLKAAIDEIVEKNITTKGEYQLTDALQVMIDHGEKIRVSKVAGWYDCGKKGTLLETNRYLLEKMDNDISIEGCTVIPPVYIGENCEISGSIIGPYTTIDDNSVVEASIIRNSIVGPQAKLSGCNLAGSLIGEAAVVHGMVQHLNVGDHSEIDFG
ncbi:MAG: NTP transferase domain-containing protein [Candidatus Marinimicrobia bacterium]|nr:NTP transferase domain-containing protein [Candidatus Neomarinimicrobiota bacterium]MCF7830082.1 NTP transferase domain-containing protein [Candidatus Neomarinimicrobiota bacterium]MCF7882129.1 NTP transferase domain-containing protein [Candidatus Neomarinimicrobiota bacterium]